jgi:hypothetical protein
MSEKLEALPVPPGGRNRPVTFASGALIGTLGGLIGLGGAEFRLPLLKSADFRGRSALPTIVLQKSFRITEHNFSGQQARRSNNHAAPVSVSRVLRQRPHQLAMNSLATSVARLRTYRSPIVACFAF